MKNKIEKAFTLIELLVVIAIIGILAGILFVAINPKEQSDKAKAAKIASDIKIIKKSFVLTALDLNRDLYPTEDELGESDNPDIKVLIEKNKLLYIPQIKANGFGDGVYRYDNDSDGQIRLIIRGASVNTIIVNELKKIFNATNINASSYLDTVYINLNRI